MSHSKRDPRRIADGLIKLLEERGTGDYIGESISQLEHSLQCAYFGALSGNHANMNSPLRDINKEIGSDNDTVIAALLHDIGQFLPLDATKDIQMAMGDHSVGRVGHEIIGEEYLKGLGFGERVLRLVGSHVAAKR